MNKFLILTVASVTLAIASPALADNESGHASCSGFSGKTIGTDAARAKATEMGYNVRRVKVEDGCYEIKATKDGRRHELLMDPATGKIVGTE